MTKTLIDELLQELWMKEKSDRIKVVNIRMNHDIYMQMINEHNATFYMSLTRDDPRITFRGIPLERTADVEKWEVVTESQRSEMPSLFDHIATQATNQFDQWVRSALRKHGVDIPEGASVEELKSIKELESVSFAEDGETLFLILAGKVIGKRTRWTVYANSEVYESGYDFEIQ